MTTTKIKAGIYCRISDDRGGEGLGVERQRLDCEQLAQQRGLTVGEPYIDNDVSAYSGKRRKRYEALLEDVMNGRINAIITWHPDRLNRSPRELERLIELLERYHVTLHTVRAGELDLNTPSGRMVARMLGAAARGESEYKSDRIRRQKQQWALTGEPSGGGYRPYGYQKDRITIDKVEAVLVREMVRRVLHGETTSSIARDFKRRAIPTVSGRRWANSTVIHIVTSPRIAGWRAVPTPVPDRVFYGHGFLVPAQWKAIVSRAKVEAVQALLKDETTRPGSNARWLLSGIALCGICGLPLKSQLRDHSKRLYKCGRSANSAIERCGRISITHAIEKVFIQRLHDAVKGGLLTRLVAAGDDAWAADRHAHDNTQRQLAGIDHDRDDGVITYSQWTNRRSRMLRRAVGARNAAEGLAHINPATLSQSPAEFSTHWALASMTEQRALIATLTANITVDPCAMDRRTDPGARVRITWRA
jgi:site-specific DNA recombinase